MANIVITSTTNSIKADFGVYAPTIKIKKGAWRRDLITSFQLADGDEFIVAYVVGENRWNLSYTNGSANLIVDSVDGVAPTSNSDLYDKLIALIV